MHIFLKLIDGRIKDLDLEGADTIALVRDKVAALTGIHPEHQRLVFGDAELLDDASTVAEHNIQLRAEIRMIARPEPRVVSLDVGGTPHTTMLSTLRQVEGSRLEKMFDGLGDHPPERAAGAGAAEEGVPREMSSVYVPQAPGGSYVIDRNGASFAYVLDYLRDLQALQKADGGAAERTDEQPPVLVLPSSDDELQRLATEADFYGLPALAAACRAGGVFAGRARGPLPKITHSEFVAMTCQRTQGNGVQTVLQLPPSDLRAVRAAFLSLYGCKLRECDLRGVDMRECNLSNADLRGADLRGANLEKANLANAQLDGDTQLAGSRLVGLRNHWSLFSCQGVDFRGAIVDRACMAQLEAIRVEQVRFGQTPMSLDGVVVEQ